jgi:hypothetical protein
MRTRGINGHQGLPGQKKKGEKAKRYTVQEARDQEAFVFNALVAGVASHLIKREFKKQFHTGLRRFDVIRNRVTSLMLDEDKQRASTRRAEAIARISETLQTLRRRAKEAERNNDLKTFRVLSAEARQQESLLADFTGARQPIKIEVETRVKETLTVLMAQMPIDVLNSHLEKYQETQRLAELGKKLLPENNPPVHTNGVTGRHHMSIKNGG